MRFPNVRPLCHRFAKVFGFLIAAHLITPIGVSAAPALDPIDRIRLAEFYRMNQILGDSIWPGWKKVPDAVLLICDSAEYLIRHPAPPAQFKSLGYDSLLAADVLWRPRVLPAHLLSTSPGMGGVATIMIGRAESTQSKASTPWVITLAHEHFHQWQMSQPWYYRSVDSLRLSSGDRTGMWMLNYPFPYDSEEFGDMFSALCRQLSVLLQTENADSLRARLRAYLSERERFQTNIKPADDRYFSFQVWQEGIARYVEWKITELAARNYKPSDAFIALPDYEPFEAVAQRFRQNFFKELTTQKLSESKRVAFYAFGAAEGMILSNLLPGWPTRYNKERFSVERLLQMAVDGMQR